MNFIEILEKLKIPEDTIACRIDNFDFTDEQIDTLNIIIDEYHKWAPKEYSEQVEFCQSLGVFNVTVPKEQTFLTGQFGTMTLHCRDNRLNVYDSALTKKQELTPLIELVTI